MHLIAQICFLFKKTWSGYGGINCTYLYMLGSCRIKWEKTETILYLSPIPLLLVGFPWYGRTCNHEKKKAGCVSLTQIPFSQWHLAVADRMCARNSNGKAIPLLGWRKRHGTHDNKDCISFQDQWEMPKEKRHYIGFDFDRNRIWAILILGTSKLSFASFYQFFFFQKEENVKQK